jgi:hypothetical protein
MPEQVDPIRTLLAARDRLVEERRALTVAIALGYRRRRTDDSQTNEMRETFVALQNTVEAIGRAIEDERLLINRPVRDAQPLPTEHNAALEVTITAPSITITDENEDILFSPAARAS